MLRLAIVLSAALVWAAPAPPQAGGQLDSTRERARVLAAADRYVKDAPVTVTASSSPRSAGGIHDYFSEGDDWWPDPQNPGGPYIQKDGMSNPGNFHDHRRALVRLSVQIPALTTAYVLTKDRKYSMAAARHARAWFLSRGTRLTPALRYAQAIHGRVTGRGTGIIDTIHLVEVARAIERLDGAPGWSRDEGVAVRRWFAAYLDWLTTDQYGQDERDTTHNHATCWVMQVAAFAQLTGNEALKRDCRMRFKTVLLQQMAADGSFPRDSRAPSRTAIHSSTSRRWRRSARSSRLRRMTCGRSSSPMAAACGARWRTCSRTSATRRRGRSRRI